MAYAIIRSGGKQYRVSEGDVVRLEKLQAEVGQEVELPEVLAVGEGADLQIGAGPLPGKALRAKVVRHGRGEKVRIFTFKRRKGFEKRKGHRQDFTEVRILALPA